MSGTKKGAKQAVQTIYKDHGTDFFKQIGSIGGKSSNTGGFAYMKRTGQTEKIRLAGMCGGTVSRRGGSKAKLDPDTIRTIKSRYSARMKLLREQSDMSQARLTAKYGVQRPW